MSYSADLLQQLFPALPGGVPRGLVGPARARSIAFPHETVAGPLVGDLVVVLPGLLHLALHRRDRGRDAGVVAAVEAMDGTGDAGHLGFVRGLAVEHVGGFEALVVSRVPERLPPAPAEATDDDFAVGGRKLGEVVRRG